MRHFSLCTDMLAFTRNSNTYYVLHIICDVFGGCLSSTTSEGRGLEMYREDLSKLAGLDARIKTTSSTHSIPHRLTSNYLSGIAGLTLAILLLIPATWLPGLLLLILPSEAFLIDWTYSKLSSHEETALGDISKEEKGNYSKLDRGKALSSWNIFSQFAS